MVLQSESSLQQCRGTARGSSPTQAQRVLFGGLRRPETLNPSETRPEKKKEAPAPGRAEPFNSAAVVDMVPSGPSVPGERGREGGREGGSPQNPPPAASGCRNGSQAVQRRSEASSRFEIEGLDWIYAFFLGGGGGGGFWCLHDCWASDLGFRVWALGFRHHEPGTNNSTIICRAATSQRELGRKLVCDL